MKFQSILIGIILLLSLCSCGTQKAVKNSSSYSAPTVQTTFFGNKFMDRQNKVKSRLLRYQPITNKDGSLTVLNMTFGGEEWHFTQWFFTKKYFFHINLQQEFNNENRAQQKYDRVRQMLETKYGYMIPLDNREGCKYVDGNMNSVVLSVGEGKSRIGATFWYCNLDYYCGAGALHAVLTTIDEM